MLEGFASPHDRVQGRRFGDATLWRWQQGGSTLPISVQRQVHSAEQTRCCWADRMC